MAGGQTWAGSRGDLGSASPLPASPLAVWVLALDVAAADSPVIQPCFKESTTCVVSIRARSRDVMSRTQIRSPRWAQASLTPATARMLTLQPGA
jgi:hypothetical protein